MSDEQDKLKLSLEPPKLFGRKKKPTAKAGTPEPATPARPANRPTTSPGAAGEVSEAPEDVPGTPAAEEATEPTVEPVEEARTGGAADAEAEEAEEAESAETESGEGAGGAAGTEEQTAVIEGVDTDAEPDGPDGAGGAGGAGGSVDASTTPVAAVPDDAADEELTSVIEDVKAAEASPQADSEPADETRIEETRVGEARFDQAPVDEAPVDEAPVDEAPVDEAPVEADARQPTARKPLFRMPRGTRGRPAADVEPEPVTDADLEDAEIAALAEDDGPLLTIYRAAALSGLVVGAAMVVLTWLSLRGCEAVRGTASCGGGPGFLLLAAIFALSVLLGSALLKAFLVPDPGGSSFLAVGFVAVIALLLLIDFLDSWAMIIVIPLLSIGAYMASVWITKTFVEPAET
ncbi:hypothetical protein [Nocardioides sp. SYSU DS0651]|uniref:hypothetical protein n=1 Tax=Nocardioides sp. SYSU DS0651 TaxID=3415955 RepID=UPI003F4C4A94